MVQISLQNLAGKVVFYGWVPRTPPWAPTGVKVPWSLKVLKHEINLSKVFCFDLDEVTARYSVQES